MISLILGVLLALPGFALATGQSYSFLHVSDPQYGFFAKDPTWTREEAMMDTLVEFINRVQPPLVIFTGDHVNQSNNVRQIEAFRRMLSRINPSTRVCLVPGNHDIGNNPTQAAYDAYEANYGSTRFSFRHGGDAFIGIDSNPLKNGDTLREAAQLRWLEQELTSAVDARYRFVFMHHPVFLKSKGEKENYSNLSPSQREKYLKLFSKHHVTILFTGHYHHTAHGKSGHMQLHTAGAVGRPLGSGISGVNIVNVEPENVAVRYTPLNLLPSISGKPRHESYRGLAMAGYQGWFNAPDDGMDRGFYHYKAKNSGLFEPGHASVDMWPDTTEYLNTYPTEFHNPDGSHARVFSSADPSTSQLHFNWMKQYGLDGVFMQRFVVEIKNASGRRHFNRVLDNCVNAATATERAIAIMYDLSGMKSGDGAILLADVDSLRRNGLFSPATNQAYLQHNGRPLVAVWGAGFNDNRRYTLGEIDTIVDGLKERGYSVLLGVPTHWRDLSDDTMANIALHDIIKKCDIVMPWFVGRYDEKSYPKFHDLIRDDIQWCQDNGVDYAPLCFPGFSWKNMKGKDTVVIDRNKGAFLKKQLDFCLGAGARMLYIAMFDEIDEGTAIFKCANTVPIPEKGTQFLPIDPDVDPAHYMQLVGQASNKLKNKKK